MEKRGSIWVEQDSRDPKRPRWTFKAVGAILSGSWSDGRNSLPFRLARMM